VHEQQPAHAAEVGSSLPAGTAELTDEEATALAEQLAEARQEEASAEAEAKLGTGRRFDEDAPPPPESAAERDEFIAEVREQEEEDADKEHEIAHQAAQAGEDTHEQTFSGESEQERDEQDTEDDEAMPGNEAQPESGAEFAADSASESESASESDSDQALADHAQALADQIGNVAPAMQQDRPQTSARIGGQPNRARFQRPMRRGGRQRSGSSSGGHRPQRQHDSRHQQAQRRPQLISEMLKAGQEILVQIAKEPLGKKGARITSHVALPGRFLVYMPTVNHIGVSRRIGSADERSRLRRLVTEAKGTFPGGFIVRTAAEGAPDDEIRADVEFLGRTWEKTLSQAEPRKAPSLLHRDLNLVERILRDYVSNDYTAIWINSQEEYSKVVEFVSRFQPKLVDRVKLYTKSTPIFEEFGIQQELDKALRPKVWLKSGGYIVINHTEALVAIDVNTGKYVGRGSTRLEDTIVKTNLEAVKEIVRQIRLRDLGGIIILDFIDMEERRNRDKVMAALDSALRADRAPSKALSFNEFGLVAVTRKRTKQALERVLCQPCPYCTGSGMVKSVPTICYEIQAEARKMSPDLDASSLTLRVHPEIAKTLKTREAALIEELEQITRKSVIIQADPTLHWEQYDIY
jgi:ribonuclease G